MRELVAYATKNGSTRQVAEAVAEACRRGATTVDLKPAGKLREPVSDYDLIVLGAPLYSGRWHRDAHRFLKRHRRDLTGKPVAVFGMGPRDDTAESWQRSRSQLDRALAKHPWLHPLAVAVFGGVDPPGRSSRRAHRDLRDWDAIRHWATQCAVAAEHPGAGKDDEQRPARQAAPDEPPRARRRSFRRPFT